MIHRFLPVAAVALLAAFGTSARAAPCPTTTITPAAALPSATVGVNYDQGFTAANTNALPFQFSVASGLPPASGFVFKATGPASADLIGAPSQAGSYVVTVAATDTSGCSGGRTYALSVAQGTQTIAFDSTAPSNATVGGTPYAVGATATSGLPVALSIDASASAVCAIAGSSVTFQSAGTCTINANQAGDANYAAAPQVQQSFAIGLSPQTIAFTSTAPTNAAVGGAAYSVAATATSGLAVAFTIDASASGVCSIAGSSVTFQSVGTCVVNANQPGNATYAPAPQVQQSFGVGLSPQTIAFTSAAPADAVVDGAAYTVAATATSGLAVTFAIDASASGVCAIAGSSVTFQGAGTCVINANQGGNATYGPAPQVQQSFVVGRGSQTIAFTSTAPVAATFGGATYTVAATATSGLSVTFTIDATSSTVCTIAGSTVSFIGTGTCTINANQAGNANWNPAPQSQQNFTVAPASQTIAFTSTAPTGATFGGATYAVAATATSGLPVTFAIDASAAAVCSISGATVSFIGVGTCVINANQAGSATYAAAPQVQQTFAVAQASQTITYTSTAPSGATFGGATYPGAATASSGLPVTFTIDASAASVCTIAGSTVSFTGAGTCVINANQAGNANYAAAPQVQQSFAVAKAAQTIDYTSLAPLGATFGGLTYAVAATATSGLAVTFAIDASSSSVCSIAGSVVSFIGAGTCTINANQAGNTNWNAASQVQQSFLVAKAPQAVLYTSTAPSAAAVGGATYTVTATATSGLPVTFTIAPTSSSVCTVAGSTVSFIGAGSCAINANQAGNANYNAAPPAQQNFVVGPGSQTITFTTTPPTGALPGGPRYAVAATATSGLPVSFSVDPSSASVCGYTGSEISLLAGGTCIVNADQGGDANWNAAPQAQQQFVVARRTQTITFNSTAPIGAAAGGDAYDVSASASSGLPVTITIDASSSAVCTLAGDLVSFIGSGTCTINANQAGDAVHQPAPQAQQSFEVASVGQTIAFTSTAPAPAVVGATYTVAAMSTSGLAVVFSIDAGSSAVCSIAGDVVTFNATGTCTINANQPGDASWGAAPQVQQSMPVVTCLTLAVGEVAKASMPGAASLCVFNAAGANAEYTYLPINTSQTSDVTGLSLTATNIVGVAGPPAPRPAGDSPFAPFAAFDDPPAVDFHDAEALESASASPLAGGRDPTLSDLVPLNPRVVGPLTVGQLVDLNVAVGGCSAIPDVRKARVEAITTPQSPGQQVLYALQEVVETTTGAGDWHPPVAGALAAQDLQNIVDSFVVPASTVPGATQTPSGAQGTSTPPLLYTGALDIATANFGALTDLDENNGLIVLFTKKMNELSPPASSAFVPGMFQARDLFSAAPGSCPGSNEGEILYMAVPDPTGVVNSNVRTVSLVYGNATSTVTHHYAHLVNAARRLYMNGAAPFEETWLNEALAYTLQNLVFYNLTGLAPRSNIVVTNLTTGPLASRRVAAFNTYENPMFGLARGFFFQIGSTNGSKRFGPLRRNPHSTGTSPTVHENAAGNFASTYMFLRYLIDRNNTGDAALFNALVNSSLNGRANLQAVIGADLDEWARDFLVAIYTDDAVAGVAPEYTIPSWNYRSIYVALNGSYQLGVDALSNGTPLNFVLGPGGGTRYTRFGVAPGQVATVNLTEGGAVPTGPITMALVRTK